MAGRKPREPKPDDPLYVRKPGERRPGGQRGPKPGEGGVYGNALPGSTAGHRFGEGNQASRGGPGRVIHGMYSRRHVEARAEAIVAALLEDGLSPDHVAHPMFAMHLSAIGRAEAVASLGWEYVMDVLEESGPGAVFGMEPGVPRALIEVWKGTEQHADRLREKMGLTPTGYAKLVQHLGLSVSAQEDRLSAAARAGREIAAKRLGIERVPETADGDVDPPGTGVS